MSATGIWNSRFSMNYRILKIFPWAFTSALEHRTSSRTDTVLDFDTIMLRDPDNPPLVIIAKTLLSQQFLVPLFYSLHPKLTKGLNISWRVVLAMLDHGKWGKLGKNMQSKVFPEMELTFECTLGLCFSTRVLCFPCSSTPDSTHETLAN